jgi:hypothetical protein
MPQPPADGGAAITTDHGAARQHAPAGGVALQCDLPAYDEARRMVFAERRRIARFLIAEGSRIGVPREARDFLLGLAERL